MSRSCVLTQSTPVQGPFLNMMSSGVVAEWQLVLVQIRFRHMSFVSGDCTESKELLMSLVWM